MRNSANQMDMDLEDNPVHMPASGGTGGGAEQGEAEQALPGPACSKLRRSARARSGSASSGSSSRSGATAALAAEKRGRRKAVSYAEAAAAEKQGGGRASSPINIDSDGSGKGSQSPGDSEPPAKKRLAESEDRGAYSDERDAYSDETMSRGRGRPQTTGLYVGRAKMQKECNRLKKEKADLDAASALRQLTMSEIFSSLERDTEKATEEMENSPTADVANRARESMAEVLRIARISKNLQGGCVKALKHSAVVATASAEVLRTRADKKESNTDSFKQVKALRRELEAVKHEMQTARREAEALRKELAVERATRKRGTGGQGRTRIVDDDDEDDDSSPPGPQTGIGQETTGEGRKEPSGKAQWRRTHKGWTWRRRRGRRPLHRPRATTRGGKER